VLKAVSKAAMLAGQKVEWMAVTMVVKTVPMWAVSMVDLKVGKLDRLKVA
jgi:hypothetical protein